MHMALSYGYENATTHVVGLARRQAQLPQPRQGTRHEHERTHARGRARLWRQHDRRPARTRRADRRTARGSAGDAAQRARGQRLGRACTRQHRQPSGQADKSKLMGALLDAVKVLKDVLRMRDDLDRLSKNVDKLANVANEIDKRLIRIETMVEIADKRNARQAKLPTKQ